MEWISGNVFIRANQLPTKGDVIDGHKHNFEHTTIVFKGAVRVDAVLPNGTKISRDFVAPSHFLVHPDVEHQITALDDNTEFWCVYSHRTPQGDVVLENNGWQGAYV